jgi:hypothetical protein
MDFMTCIWDVLDVAYVVIRVKDFPEKGITLDDVKPLIYEIREKAKEMIITVDLSHVGLVGIDRSKMIMSICQEVIDYTKDDNLLKRVEFENAGFIFRTLYSLAIPKYFRDIVVFL